MRRGGGAEGPPGARRSGSASGRGDMNGREAQAPSAKATNATPVATPASSHRVPKPCPSGATTLSANASNTAARTPLRIRAQFNASLRLARRAPKRARKFSPKRAARQGVPEKAWRLSDSCDYFRRRRFPVAMAAAVQPDRITL